MYSHNSHSRDRSTEVLVQQLLLVPFFLYWQYAMTLIVPTIINNNADVNVDVPPPVSPFASTLVFILHVFTASPAVELDPPCTACTRACAASYPFLGRYIPPLLLRLRLLRCLRSGYVPPLAFGGLLGLLPTPWATFAFIPLFLCCIQGKPWGILSLVSLCHCSPLLSVPLNWRICLLVQYVKCGLSAVHSRDVMTRDAMFTKGDVSIIQGYYLLSIVVA